LLAVNARDEIERASARQLQGKMILSSSTTLKMSQSDRLIRAKVE
jgi:hypothetical protein